MKPATKKYILLGGVALAVYLVSRPSLMARLEALLAELEGLSLTAYPDGGKWSIGFGNQWNYNAGRPVRQGDVITRADAFKFRRLYLQEQIPEISQAITVPVNQSQRVALISYAYNVGTPGFKSSDVLRALNSGQDKQAVANVLRKSKLTSQGVYVPGLATRREKEAKMFLS